MKIQRIILALVLASLAGTFVACGAQAKVQEAAARVKYTNDMKQFGICMHDFHTSKGRMPKDMNELTSVVQVPPEAQAIVSSGELKVEWGMWKLGDQINGTSNTIMATSNAAIFKGNVGVILADGSVMQMSQAEVSGLSKPVMPTESAPKKR